MKTLRQTLRQQHRSGAGARDFARKRLPRFAVRMLMEVEMMKKKLWDVAMLPFCQETRRRKPDHWLRLEPTVSRSPAALMMTGRWGSHRPLQR